MSAVEIVPKSLIWTGGDYYLVNVQGITETAYNGWVIWNKNSKKIEYLTYNPFNKDFKNILPVDWPEGWVKNYSPNHDFADYKNILASNNIPNVGDNFSLTSTDYSQILSKFSQNININTQCTRGAALSATTVCPLIALKGQMSPTTGPKFSLYAYSGSPGSGSGSGQKLDLNGYGFFLLRDPIAHLFLQSGILTGESPP